MATIYDIENASVNVSIKNANDLKVNIEIGDLTDMEEFYNKCLEAFNVDRIEDFIFSDIDEVPEDLIDENGAPNESFFDLLYYYDEIENTDAFWTYVYDNGSHLSDPKKVIDSFNDEYRGEWDSEEEFATDLMYSCYDIPSYLADYIDYDKYASDLFSSDYTFIDGYVFCNC